MSTRRFRWWQSLWQPHPPLRVWAPLRQTAGCGAVRCHQTNWTAPANRARCPPPAEDLVSWWSSGNTPSLIFQNKGARRLVAFYFINCLLQAIKIMRTGHNVGGLVLRILNIHNDKHWRVAIRMFWAQCRRNMNVRESLEWVTPGNGKSCNMTIHEYRHCFTLNYNDYDFLEC